MQPSWPPASIAATLKATRAASPERLLEEARQRAQNRVPLAQATLEAKTGYKVGPQTEFKQMEVLLRLDEEGPLQIIPTYMGAHAVPPDYKGDTAGYIRFLTLQALPELRKLVANPCSRAGAALYYLVGCFLRRRRV